MRNEGSRIGDDEEEVLVDTGHYKYSLLILRKTDAERYNTGVVVSQDRWTRSFRFFLVFSACVCSKKYIHKFINAEERKFTTCFDG